MITKEEIRKKLEEDPSWTLPDNATDEEWDMYFEVKDEMNTGDSTDDDWGVDSDEDEESF
ncbi:MAG TPA: hypothetical protein PLM44_01485 [bacterium]|nr:hypothetical protein [bacterium]HQG58490.1 hypothetical protein [bacterium]HQG79001.1 hypothetical protein [bacterium]HQK41492.1 hypothetical protein [bacterium]